MTEQVLMKCLSVFGFIHVGINGNKPLRSSWKTGKIWKICHLFHSWWLSQLGNVAGSIFLLLLEPHFISAIHFRILGWDYHCEKQIHFSILIKKSTYYGLEWGWGFFNSLVGQVFPSELMKGLSWDRARSASRKIQSFVSLSITISSCFTPSSLISKFLGLH